MPSNLSDVKFYSDANSELAGFNDTQVLSHQNIGLDEEGTLSPLGNLNFSRSSNSETNFSNGELTESNKWTQQFGTSSDEVSQSIAVDRSGNVYITGYTYGSLSTNAGNADAWLTKYDSSGNQQWTQQFGTTDYDFSNDVAVDYSGDVYITGYTYGSLADTNAGNTDAWLTKYDSTGNQQWTQQFGTTDYDFSNGVAVDSGKVYVTGYTYGSLAGTNAGDSDAWIAQYDTSGNRQWTQQFGITDSDQSNDIAVDISGNVYITGYTYGSLGGTNLGSYDGWVAKYNSSGNQQWIQQFGTTDSDNSQDVAVDSSGNVYVTGINMQSTTDSTAWVAKYDSSGNQQWTQQVYVSGYDVANGLAVDKLGNVYITGFTGNSLGNRLSSVEDAWVAKYNNTGNRQWVQQLDSSNDFTYRSDYSNSVAVDSGNVYITGYTYGFLGGTNAGSSDVWVAKYS